MPFFISARWRAQKDAIAFGDVVVEQLANWPSPVPESTLNIRTGGEAALVGGRDAFRTR